MTREPSVSRSVALVIVVWISVSVVMMALAFVYVCITKEVKDGRTKNTVSSKPAF